MEDVENLEIISYPDPRLRVESAAPGEVDDFVVALAERMKQLTLEANGLGLAASQTGVNLRLFIGREADDVRDFEVYVNPVLRDGDGDAVLEEGCLSLPDIRGEIFRPKTITIEYTTLAGEKRVRTDDGLQARMWQHENDHLNGVLILDRFGPMDKLRNRRLIKALEKRHSSRRSRPSGGRRPLIATGRRAEQTRADEG